MLPHMHKAPKRHRFPVSIISHVVWLYVSVNFPALYDSAKSLASMLYGRIARNSSLFLAL